MTDLFLESVPDEWIDRVFGVMATARHHRFQVLTKRADRMREYMTNESTPFRIARAMDAMQSHATAGPEEILSIDGFPGYFASSHGYIYSEKRGRRRRMSPDAGAQGHQRVTLHREGGGPRGERFLVHRLILETFVGPAPTPGTQGRHRDGDPSNNALTNLLWGDQSENWDDSKRHGSHRRHSKLTSDDVEAIRSRLEFGATKEALAREFGVSATQVRHIASGKQWNVDSPIAWPPARVWLGVSAEDQRRAEERIPLLLDTPAAIRFVSAEPLLGPINLRRLSIGTDRELYVDALTGCHTGYAKDGPLPGRRAGLDWVIVGSESGPKARPCNLDWVRSIRDQRALLGIPLFWKQHAQNGKKIATPALDGKRWTEQAIEHEGE